MSHPRNQGPRLLCQVRLLSLLALALAACTKEAATPSSPHTFELAFSGAGPFFAGKQAVVAITLTAKAGFHVNPEYPVSFKPEGFEAVKFAGDRVPLTAGSKTPCAEKAEDACQVEFPLPLTPEKAGAAKIAGVLGFSVCSADKCLIEKEPLTLAIKVE